MTEDKEVNFFMIGILLSGVAYMVIGMLWYGPLFAKPWMKLVGLTESKMDEMKKKGMAMSYGLSFVSALVAAFVLNWVLNLNAATTVGAAVNTAFMLWLGFVATSMLTAKLFLDKPWKLYLIDSGYHLATLVASAIILTLLK